MFCPKCNRAVQAPRGVSLCPHCGSRDLPVLERRTLAMRKRAAKPNARPPKIRPPVKKKRAK